jgi:hypothetical protein
MGILNRKSNPFRKSRSLRDSIQLIANPQPIPTNVARNLFSRSGSSWGILQDQITDATELKRRYGSSLIELGCLKGAFDVVEEEPQASTPGSISFRAILAKKEILPYLVSEFDISFEEPSHLMKDKDNLNNSFSRPSFSVSSNDQTNQRLSYRVTVDSTLLSSIEVPTQSKPQSIKSPSRCSFSITRDSSEVPVEYEQREERSKEEQSQENNNQVPEKRVSKKICKRLIDYTLLCHYSPENLI